MRTYSVKSETSPCCGGIVLVAGFKMYGSPNYGDSCSQVEAGKVTVSTRHKTPRIARDIEYIRPLLHGQLRATDASCTIF
jgi:hypothetical protein